MDFPSVKKEAKTIRQYSTLETPPKQRTTQSACIGIVGAQLQIAKKSQTAAFSIGKFGPRSAVPR